MSEDLWTVGALARLVGVSPDSIRHYERIGILPKAARSRAGYRCWPRRDVEYMKWVGPARRAGFTLRELARVFQMYRTGVARRDTGAVHLEYPRQLAQREPRTPGRPHPFHVLHVAARPATVARSRARRLGQDPDSLIVPDAVRAHPHETGERANGPEVFRHCSSPPPQFSTLESFQGQGLPYVRPRER